MRAHPPSKIWVIIPGFNEERYIARVLKKVQRNWRSVIYVDDGSRDRSATIARKFTPHVLQHRVNLGKGAALKTGCEYAFKHCGASAVILMDADDQHDPQELPLFIKALRKGHQVVFGVRAVNQDMPLLRRAANTSASWIVKALFGSYIPDIPSGYKAFTRRAYKKIQWFACGYEVEMEIAVRTAKTRLDFVTVCIQTIYHDMNKGMTMLDVFQMMTKVVTWRFTV